VEAVLYREKYYVESGKLSLIKRNIVLQFTFGKARERRRLSIVFAVYIGMFFLFLSKIIGSYSVTLRFTLIILVSFANSKIQNFQVRQWILLKKVCTFEFQRNVLKQVFLAR
jgi:hypothetical protein